MPPKKAPGPSKKTEQKKKEKIIEDKTFGLKNKKGAKQQKFIQQVQKQVQSGGQHPKVDGKKKDDKDKKLAEQRELALIFKPVQGQKVEKGTDPKSVVCAFFKQGTCTKGDKCKFSHDLSIENKAEKRSIYVDMRDAGDDEDMSNWDEAKLKEVVDKKHSTEKRRPTTDIICKYFLEAVEKSKYGWFWECPNGEKCIYRHALPPGYVLKKDKKKDDKPTEISLVDLIEKERAALGSNLTRVTLESFLSWKKRKIQEKKDKLAADEERKKNDYNKGRQFGISGREMFSFNPDLVDDGPMEEGDAAFDSYKRDEDDETVEFKELDLESLSMAAQEVDGTGTVASESRLKEQAEAAVLAEEALENDVTSTSSDNIEANFTTSDATPINTELFMDLANELDDLDLEDEDDDEDDD